MEVEAMAMEAKVKKKNKKKVEAAAGAYIYGIFHLFYFICLKKKKTFRRVYNYK